jgi:hypothetical protein
MRIVLSSIGTVRQMHPMIALGLALHERDHTVTFCAPEKHRTWIMKVGFPIVSSGRDFERVFSKDADLFAELKAVISEIPVQFVSFRDACKEADVVVASGLQLASQSISEGRKIPYHYVIDHSELLRKDHLPGSSVRKAEKIWNRDVKDVINRERDHMHLPPIDDLSNYLFRFGKLLITVPNPPANAPGEVTGPWISENEDFSSPEAADAFKQRWSEQAGLMKALELIELTQ